MNTTILNNKIAIALRYFNGYYKLFYNGIILDQLFFFCKQFNCYVGLYEHKETSNIEFLVFINDIKSNDMGLKEYLTSPLNIDIYHIFYYSKRSEIIAGFYNETTPFGSPLMLPTSINNMEIFNMLKMSLPKQL